MKKILSTSILLFSAAAMPHVPDDGGGIGPGTPHPSGQPSHGPVRPRNELSPFPVTADPRAYDLELNRVAGPESYIHIQAIFWGAHWNDKAFSSDRISGLDEFYSGYDLSTYSMITREYLTPIIKLDGLTSTSAGSLPIPRSHYGGHIVDASPVPWLGAAGFGGGGGDFNVAVGEICKMLSEHRIEAHENGPLNYFPVYVSRRRPSLEACQYHGFSSFGWGDCPSAHSSSNKATFAVALFYDVNGDEQCDVHDYFTGHSPGLASLANLSARAMADIQTDWDFIGWYDQEGNEIDDKCAWTFIKPFVVLANGSTWKLQSLWSNEAFDAGNGALNADGAAGCVDGSHSPGVKGR